MSTIVINIGGVDKTTTVEQDGFMLQRAKTNQIDTVNFKIILAEGDSYKPAVLDDVEIIEDSTTIFGGQIVEIRESVEGKAIQIIECTAKDYSFDMDRTLVIANYTSETVEDIIADIATNFLDAAYDISNVSCPLVVSYVQFNYEYPSKCLQQLAEQTGYDWYVDHDKKIYFFSNEDNPAPFNLTDTSDNYYYNSLKVHTDIKNIHNSIVVRGGEYLGSNSSESLIADGTALIYKQGLRYNTVVVTVAGAGKTVGIDNIDDPTGFDCLYNYQEKFVRFTVATKPSNGQTVVVSGYPYIPVIVEVLDTASIATYGKFEFKIVDKSILSKEAARERARAEIANWAQTLEDGSFDTRTTGLEVGQKINVQSDIRDIDQDFIISRISTRFVNGTQFVHSVTLVTTQTNGMIEFLQKLLINKDKEIEIKSGEVSDEVHSEIEEITVDDGNAVVTSKAHNPQMETITVAETVTAQALDYGVQFVVGVQGAPTTTKRQFILNGSRLG